MKLNSKYIHGFFADREQTDSENLQRALGPFPMELASGLHSATLYCVPVTAKAEDTLETTRSGCLRLPGRDHHCRS